jgi:hypothetical protein
VEGLLRNSIQESDGCGQRGEWVAAIVGFMERQRGKKLGVVLGVWGRGRVFNLGNN